MFVSVKAYPSIELHAIGYSHHITLLKFKTSEVMSIVLNV